MNAAHSFLETHLGGVIFRDETQLALQATRQCFQGYLGALGIYSYVLATTSHETGGFMARYQLHDIARQHLAAHGDTMGLCSKLGLDTYANSDDLQREILLAMLASPIPFSFPNHDELVSAVRMRQNIVVGARKTALAFDTEHAERPEQYWTYSLDRGFTIKPGQSLIEALQKTTQPERSGKLYSFSCYRATEYVLLLAIAQELSICNVPLLDQLQRQWETRAIMSAEFHDVFLHEYGSMADPLPPRYYVPGDRLWFRNPDEASANVEGYEGSWVFYLGDGYFTNFWKRDQPFTLVTKCVELFHWRNATYRDEQGKLQVDEAVVEARVARSLEDTREVDRIVSVMLHWRDPSGIYEEGGCVDSTRECPRQVRAATSQMTFPG